MAEQFSVSYHSVRLPHSETRRWITEAVKVSSGLGRELPLSKLIAVKLPLEFRFPEAVLHH